MNLLFLKCIRIIVFILVSLFNCQFFINFELIFFFLLKISFYFYVVLYLLCNIKHLCFSRWQLNLSIYFDSIRNKTYISNIILMCTHYRRNSQWLLLYYCTLSYINNLNYKIYLFRLHLH